ncbi:MAG: 26S protease regulatory subunit [Acidobacteriaceae bacterium]|nr:26S protease regulatory subunit [Acidobacteriaceae bacterium]MBV9499558.1 26S protease regulatory subunit [Acidobacteriaceae bacterium]
MVESGRKLTPVQSEAKAFVRKGLEVAPVLALGGDAGRGKSTVLADLHAELGSTLIDISDLLKETGARHPLALEESAFEVVLRALKGSDIVIADHFDILVQTVCCSHSYPRLRWFDGACVALCDYAAQAGKKVIFSYSGMLPGPIHQRAIKAGIARFRAEDYQSLAANYLGDVAEYVNFQKVFRFAPKLNAYQLKAAFEWLLRYEPEIDTEKLIEYLRSQRLTSNVDLEEVQEVTLADLVGVDDVIRELEIHVALPLENDQLANELNLRPKRGVLLYGPPGTGKTSVGRALAHRLRGKFFLIDGTFIAGTGEFYARVHQVFEAAKENAPAVIFIDDADAIFEGGEEHGLYRYLLTMLDGLESESAGRVCVMMTAMDVRHLPLALVRSGRVELWLEMKLPDAEARRIILARQMAQAGSIFDGGDCPAVVSATEGFTGADLKRVVEDAKGLFAFDRANGNAKLERDGYLLRAIESVALNKTRYAEAEMGARQKLRSAPNLGVPFMPGMAIGGISFSSDWSSSE